MEDSFQIEKVGGGVEVCVSKAHTFGTDSFLLSYFAAPKKYEQACDFCTGCGIVPLLWFREKSHPVKAYGIDIQEQAVEQLRQSVERSGLAGKLVPIQADLRELKGVLPMGELHLVTCNPPYKAVDTGLLSEEGSDKIARHEIMCTLDDMVKSAAALLRYGGRLCLCQLPERLVDVLTIMRRHKIEPKRIRFAQGHPDKAPWLVLVEGKLGAKPFLQVEKPLILRDENGNATEEMKEIYKMYGFTGEV